MQVYGRVLEVDEVEEVESILSLPTLTLSTTPFSLVPPVFKAKETGTQLPPSLHHRRLECLHAVHTEPALPTAGCHILQLHCGDE